MNNLEGCPTEHLYELERSWLAVVDQVTTTTACLIIQRLGEIRAILEERGVYDG